MPQRHVHVRRVADVRAPVGEGQRARLEVVVQRIRRGHAAQPEPLEDVQCLAHRGAARGRRRHPVDVETAVADAGRLLLQDAVAREVAGRQVARRDRQVGVGALGRALCGPRDLVGEPAVVERLRALPGDQGVGRREVGVLQHRADRRRVAAGQEQLAGGGEVREAALVLGGLEVERLVDDEASAGQPGGRGERVGQVAAAPLLQRCLPGGQRSRRTDRDAAGEQLGLLRSGQVGLLGLGVDERVARHRRGRGLPAVDRLDLAGASAVVHEVAAAPDAGAVGLGHAQSRGGRDGRVDRVAAALEHLEADAGRVGVDRGDGAAVPRGRGSLPGLGPCCGRGRLRAGRRCDEDSGETGERGSSSSHERATSVRHGASRDVDLSPHSRQVGGLRATDAGLVAALPGTPNP